ncbi:MAG TPA: cytochrome c [Terriglobales bacterium]|jgi:mono/diheme cytochrome c family protein|nr:cytochrome c [Terriglobales bacterium]
MLQMGSRLAPCVLVCLAIAAVPNRLLAQDDGAKIFKASCVLCHSEDGSGNSPTGKALKAKDLRSDEVQAKTDADLTEAISKGKGKMPAFGAKLSPEKVKSLVAYIRQLPKK